MHKSLSLIYNNDGSQACVFIQTKTRIFFQGAYLGPLLLLLLFEPISPAVPSRGAFHKLLKIIKKIARKLLQKSKKVAFK